eukprot:UC4_evm3s526
MDTTHICWQKIDLASLQETWKKDIQNIDKNKVESLRSLSELKKVSRSLANEIPKDLRLKISPLVKRFQSEIESLKSRCEYVESCSTKLFDKFIDVPDPSIELTNQWKKSKQFAAIEAENEQLRKTIADYQQEFLELKNQDVTIKKLKEQLKQLEKNSEDYTLGKIKEKERTLRKDFAEKEHQLTERQLLVATKLGKAEETSTFLQAALDRTQVELLEINSVHESELATCKAEVEILSADLQRAEEKATSLASELESAKDSISLLERECSRQPASLEAQLQTLSEAALETEIAGKDREILHLIDSNRSLQIRFGKLQNAHEETLTKLDAAVHDVDNLQKDMKIQIEGKEDYEQIKEELTILKSAEFDLNSKQIDNEYASKPLEILLLEKNRTLKDKISELESDLRSNELKMKDKIMEKERDQKKLESQELLIFQLESDLATLKTTEVLKEDEQNNIPDLIEDLSTGDNQNYNQSVEKIESQTNSKEDSILPILSSQRDRFRAKNIELEDKNRNQKERIFTLEKEVQHLTSDNIKLYEKIKFLHNYSNKRSYESEDLTKKYHRKYEEHNNPFRDWSSRERQKRFANMGPADKIIMSMGKMILGSKIARTFYVMYIVVIHMLIFLVLYKYSHDKAGHERCLELGVHNH